MKLLWDGLTDLKTENGRPYRLFLFLNTLIWSLPEFMVTLLICRGFSLPLAETIGYAGTVTGYIGLGVGFFGGLLFLLRNSK